MLFSLVFNFIFVTFHYHRCRLVNILERTRINKRQELEFCEDVNGRQKCAFILLEDEDDRLKRIWW